MKKKLLVSSHYIGTLFIESIIFILLLSSSKVALLLTFVNTKSANKVNSNVSVTNQVDFFISNNFLNFLKNFSFINLTNQVAFNYHLQNNSNVNFNSGLGKKTLNIFTI
ncbi:MAG: hypothetical protein ACOYMA_09740 [Bacteroidia bacterium]